MLASWSAHASHRRSWIGSFLELLAQLKCHVFVFALECSHRKASSRAPLAAMDCELLYMENEHFSLVDALPYIDTQLGAAEVAQQVKALIEEEMTQFEPRDYLASLPAPELPFLNSSNMQERVLSSQYAATLGSHWPKEVWNRTARRRSGRRWRIMEEDRFHGSDELRIHTHQVIELRTPGAMGQKGLDSSQYAWFVVLRKFLAKKPLRSEQAEKRWTRNENLTRSLVATTCESWCVNLKQYQQDNSQVEQAVRGLESDLKRLRDFAIERGVDIADVDPMAIPESEMDTKWIKMTHVQGHKLLRWQSALCLGVPKKLAMFVHFELFDRHGELNLHFTFWSFSPAQKTALGSHSAGGMIAAPLKPKKEEQAVLFTKMIWNTFVTRVVGSTGFLSNQSQLT